MKALIEVRSQKSRGSSNGKFGGPDKYIAVQVVPDNSEPLSSLREDIASKRGIQIIYCGEFYSRSTGPRSRYADAMRYAQEVAGRYNG